MKKIDFKKLYKERYNQSAKKISYVEVLPSNYLTVDGTGYPEDNPDFGEKMGALYGIAYTLKFMLKEKSEQPAEYSDFTIPPLEAFWFMENCNDFNEDKKEDWQWTLMILQPDFITQELVQKAKDKIILKNKINRFTNDVRLEQISDGKAVQLLHLGPYNKVSETVKMLMGELESNKLKPARKYREIYLNDPRKTSPEKLKTICRLPYE